MRAFSKSLTFCLLALLGSLTHADDCHPLPTPGTPQYIVGYGSLMQEASRLRTAPSAKQAWPVRVAGYRRAWIAQGSPVGFSTTFLGIKANAYSTFNAALFALESDAEVTNMDAREDGYCRAAVSGEQLTLLGGEAPASGEIWIYVNKPQRIAAPSARFPIVQSYVDIFVGGCLELERQYQLQGFAEECIGSTYDWSKHWVNDRIYPRRPFIYQPNAMAIDKLLQSRLPVLFKGIRIE